MVKKIFAQAYLWILLLLLYSPIVIIVIYSFTEAKVLGNWTGFSTKLYSSLFTTGAHHSLMNALINTITIALLAATASTLSFSQKRYRLVPCAQDCSQIAQFGDPFIRPVRRCLPVWCGLDGKVLSLQIT